MQITANVVQFHDDGNGISWLNCGDLIPLNLFVFMCFIVLSIFKILNFHWNHIQTSKKIYFTIEKSIKSIKYLKCKRRNKYFFLNQKTFSPCIVNCKWALLDHPSKECGTNTTTKSWKKREKKTHHSMYIAYVYSKRLEFMIVYMHKAVLLRSGFFFCSISYCFFVVVVVVPINIYDCVIRPITYWCCSIQTACCLVLLLFFCVLHTYIPNMT